MKKNTSKKFIEFIDSYALQIENNQFDYEMMTSMINLRYLEEKLYDKKIANHSTVHKMYYYHNNPQFHLTENCDNYSKWKNDHQYDISFNTSPIVRTAVSINVSINSINDILSIIKTYEYDVNTDYNIDLKLLYNIENELIELNNMIGMESLKKSIIEQLLYFIQELHIGKNISEFKHTVIIGPPGTGKTEIAKIIGKMYSKLGILKNNIFKKATRNDLIAGYLGQTAIKTRKVIDESMGGVLFIDEAYSLGNDYHNDSFSKECIDTLCEALSDNKNDLMVIIAGYEEELNETFFKSNKGLQSRFIWRMKMEPFTMKEMMNIFKKKVFEQEWSFYNENEIAEKWFQDKKNNFQGNGRDMEMLLIYTKIAHGKRIYGKSTELRKKISLDDLNRGYDIFIKNKEIKKEKDFMNSIYI
jgi:tetratricopeptide (TPR) repeat protein